MVDETNYRPAAKILAEFSDLVKGNKQLNQIIKNHEIRTIKPSPQRLCLHLGDWYAYVDKVTQNRFENLDQFAFLQDLARLSERYPTLCHVLIRPDDEEHVTISDAAYEVCAMTASGVRGWMPWGPVSIDGIVTFGAYFDSGDPWGPLGTSWADLGNANPERQKELQTAVGKFQEIAKCIEDFVGCRSDVSPSYGWISKIYDALEPPEEIINARDDSTWHIRLLPHNVFLSSSLVVNQLADENTALI